MRSTDALLLLQVGEEGQRLNRLTQPHLVGQDAIDASLVQRDDPIEARQLVVLQLTTLQQLRLLVESREAVALLNHFVIVDVHQPMTPDLLASHQGLPLDLFVSRQ